MGNYGSLLLALLLVICLRQILASETPWFENIEKEFGFQSAMPSTLKELAKVQTKVTRLTFKPCGKPGPVRINSLKIDYDEENDILLSYSFTSDVDLDSPLKGFSSLCRNLPVVPCVEVNCIDRYFGTCKFLDLCTNAKYFPFGCPLKKGKHSTTEKKVKNPTVIRQPFMFGQYKFEFKVENGDRQTLACIKGKFVLKEI